MTQCCGFAGDRETLTLSVCDVAQCRHKYIVLFSLFIWTPDGVTCKPKWSQCNQKHCREHILHGKCANGNMPAVNESCNQSGFRGGCQSALMQGIFKSSCNCTWRWPRTGLWCVVTQKFIIQSCSYLQDIDNYTVQVAHSSDVLEPVLYTTQWQDQEDQTIFTAMKTCVCVMGFRHWAVGCQFTLTIWRLTATLVVVPHR
jgi:hypothetical protein